MIGTLRKHQKWLWGFIIAATIVSFVLYLDPSHSRFSGGGGGSGSDMNAGSINGEPISMDQYQQALREAKLYYFLHNKKWIDRPEDMEKNGFDGESWAYERLLIGAVMKSMKIQVPDEAAARTTKQMFGLEPSQALPVDEFNKFVQGELGKNGISLEDFDRFVRNQTGIEHLITLFGMSGRLITSKEAEFFYRRENEPMQTEIARFSISNYFSKINITPKDLEEFYTKRQADYRIPERAQLNYIRLDLTNFFAEADKKIAAITNYNQAVENTYLQRGQANFTNELGKVMTADEAKAKIKKNDREDRAREAAAMKAREIILSIYQGHDENYQFTTNDIYAAAKTNGVTVKTTAQFDERTGPIELGVTRQANSLLFNLTDKGSSDQFYPTSPLGALDAVYVVGFSRRYPSEAQSLSAVREKVFADYRQEKAEELLRADGEKFQKEAGVGLSKGQNFDAICAANNIKPVTLPSYSMTSTNSFFKDRGDFETLQSATFNLPTGKCSGFIPMEDGGMVAYVKARMMVDPSRMQFELPMYLSRMREQRQMAAFQEWFQRQVADMHLVRAFNFKANKTDKS